MKKFGPKDYLIEEPIICPHCADEYYERPRPYTLVDFMEDEAGFTILGLQIWCKKHKRNICHIDFDGKTVKTFMDILQQSTH